MPAYRYYKSRRGFYRRRPFIRQPGAFASRRMPNNPSPFIKQPWNRWTYQTTESLDAQQKDINITTAQILQSIQGGGQIDPAAKIRFKVKDAQIWCTSKGPDFALPNLSAKFLQTTSSNSSIKYPRSSMNDRGTLYSPAKVGYRWPLTDRMVILDGDSAIKNLVELDVRGKGTEVTKRINVYWQTGEP